MTDTTAPAAAAMPVTRRRLDRDDLLMRGGICLLIGWLGVTLLLPLWWLLSKSFQNQSGEFVGLANYIQYFSTPALFASVWNSLFINRNRHCHHTRCLSQPIAELEIRQISDLRIVCQLKIRA